jgi:ABC-type branched-subunit amino acid transport system substrate-binding protein
MPKRRAYCGAVVLAMLLVSCSDTNWHPDPSEQSNEKLVIDVFWSASDSEQGYSAIKEGAIAAEDTDEFKEAGNYIKLNLQDDKDSPEEEASVARNVSLNPGVLAVIGHSRSGTTRAAMPFYAQANIPVLIPAATSPYVLYQFDERAPWPSVDLVRHESAYRRFPNAFRLRPSDVPDQVSAMKLALNKLAGSQKPKVMLICDTTSLNGSDIYTKPMCDSFLYDPEFSSKIASYRPFALDSDIYGLVTEIHAVNPNYIVILGYPELARDVLEELKERAPKDQMKLPYTFIMPEACLQNYLIRFSHDIYVTSSFNAGQPKNCDSQLAQKLFDHLSKVKPAEVVLTDESYTFDAVLILSEAVISCKERVDRACVMRYLEINHGQLHGACETYLIDSGERRNTAFNVDAVCGDTFKVKWFARPGGKTIDENPHWCKQRDR